MGESTQTGVAMAIVGLLGTIAGLFFSWLKDRDKYQFDKKLNDQSAEIDRLKKDCEECKESRKQCEEQHVSTQVELRELRARDQRDRDELEARIEALERGKQ